MTTSTVTPDPTAPAYDVLVVGGGAAGLSGALALGRARRRVLVLDAGEPRNAPAAGVHNYLGHEGLAPAELLSRGRAEVGAYGVQVRTGRSGRAVAARRRDGDAVGFVLTTADGDEVTASRVLLATGLVDALPDLPGVAEHWGTAVLHCPYCHGHEVRDQRLVVLATSAASGHQAQLWRQWSEHVSVVADPDLVRLTDRDLERLAARGVEVVTTAAVGLEGRAGALDGVRLADGRLLPADAVVVAPRFEARTDLLADLGLVVEEVRQGEVLMGSAVPVGPAGETSVAGVRVAGNLGDLTGQVVTAAAAGLVAGAALNAELVAQETDLAVAAVRADAFERPSWEQRYAGDGSLWSGRANAQLEAEASHLVPGRALDVGCGEGGDALWLAGRGWQVTGLDFAQAGLDRAAARAGEAGLADRTAWRRADVRSWEPGDERWDLVTAHFLHLPDGGMVDVVRRLAAGVAPGGHLLVVGHHPEDLHHQGVRHGRRDWLHTAESLLPALEPDAWDVEVVETRPREQWWTPSGEPARRLTVQDAVLRARRREAVAPH